MPTNSIQPLPPHRQVHLCTALVAFIVWLATCCQPPSLTSLLNYVALITWTAAAILELCEIVPRASRIRIPLAIAGSIAAVVLWRQFDSYQTRWENENGTTYVDNYTRSGRLYYRSTNLRDLSNRPGDWWRGPMAGDPPRPHGHWTFTMWDPIEFGDHWYWYGETITQGEWELRNR